ncbi:MAG: ABC transporter permease [Patescibacteria group bacterium]|nr:ABC transporter permease [Patescibacteria group bacterium]MDE1988675.1 ABC transporter permease [Patescibacteria group bacterium]MDE2217941.1 ABC transporter permease [Patescibacteria group bacterium]
MLITKAKRVIKAGFVNFWRNGFVSLASILVMTITLFVIGSVIFLGTIFNYTFSQIKEKVDISVYFVTSSNPQDIMAIKKNLEALPEVAKISYTSREEALADFKKKHENDEQTLQALQELNDNPLGAFLNIKAKEPSQYEGIANYLQSKDVLTKDGISIIDKVNYYQNKAAIDRFTKIIDGANKIGLGLIIVLVAFSIIITFNTIRLAIYVSREEISVMKLVGASNQYIRGPFVVSGIMYGFVSAMFTLILFYPITLYSTKATDNFLMGFNLFDYYIKNFGQLFLIIAGSGILIGAISSYWAVRRYLRI